MTGPQSDSDRLLALAEPWVILAASTLISACYRQNFSTITLLQSPVRCGGQIQGTLATIDLPGWFPAQEAVLEVAGGALYAKLKDIALPTQSQKIGDAVRLQIDLRGIALVPQAPATITLTYFPWFRFLSEPVNFDAMNKAAEYVAACFAFLFRRSALDPVQSLVGERHRISSKIGITLDVHGLGALEKLVISKDALETSFDLINRRIAIDRRMFPAACLAGDEMLKTGDRPRHMSVEANGTHLILAAKGA